MIGPFVPNLAIIPSLQDRKANSLHVAAQNVVHEGGSGGKKGCAPTTRWSYKILTPVSRVITLGTYFLRPFIGVITYTVYL